MTDQWDLRCINWVNYGYCLFVASSVLFFIQALNPYLPLHNSGGDDAYYANGPLDDFDITGWLGMTATVMNVVESVFYIIDWTLDRYYITSSNHPSQVHKSPRTQPNRRYDHEFHDYQPWYRDWNHWGNILFLFGSIGYIFTSYWYLGMHTKTCCITLS
jgi:hypothetical protein